MSDEKRRDTDAPIDWSSSPIAWSSSPIDWSSSPSAAATRAPLTVEADPPPRPRPRDPDRDDDREVEVAPEDLEDFFDEREQHARAQIEQAHHAGAPGHHPPPVTRSPFAALLYLAFGGYLAWFAFHAYEGLGALHARSHRATMHELDALREAHGRLTDVVAVHAIPAACFGLGALFLLGRKRGAGLFFGLLGIGVTIFTIYASLRTGDRELLRPDDVVVKLCGLAAVAWFRPRA